MIEVRPRVSVVLHGLAIAGTEGIIMSSYNVTGHDPECGYITLDDFRRALFYWLLKSRLFEETTHVS